MVEDDRERNLGATGYDRLPMSTRQPPGDTAAPSWVCGAVGRGGNGERRRQRKRPMSDSR
jgi:hypothetical protein